MYSFSLFYRQKRTKQSKRQVYRNTQKQCGEEAQKETIRLTHPLFVRLASCRFPDFVEKVGRTSGKILAARLLKPEKTTGVYITYVRGLKSLLLSWKTCRKNPCSLICLKSAAVMACVWLPPFLFFIFYLSLVCYKQLV